MEYIDAHCARCGTWQTALVGYDASQICLTCGEVVGARRPGTELATVGQTVEWLAESWDAGGGLSPEQRRERLRSWARRNGVGLPEDLVGVLAHCDSASEVRFALPIVTLSSWRVVGERTVSDGHWTLRVQHEVGAHRADFVLSGQSLRRPLVVDVEAAAPPGSAPRVPGPERFLALQAQGYLVLRIPAHEAKDRGVAFRRALYREALPGLEAGGGAIARSDPAGATPSRVRRIWPTHELVYNVADEPLELRRELVEDWLRSRGVSLQPWQYDFLAHCERAAEVHFALPFLRLPNAEPVDARTLHLDPWHTLRAQVEADGHTFDFLFMTALPGSEEVVSTLVEIHPARGARDREAERARTDRWAELGWEVLQLAATDARQRGEHWAERLLREIAWRRTHEAS